MSQLTDYEIPRIYIQNWM